MDDESMISLVYDYASEHPDFCTAFIESLEEAIQTYGQLIDSQSEALGNIVDRFRMVKWEKQRDKRNSKIICNRPDPRD